jgi:fumarate hydratase class I
MRRNLEYPYTVAKIRKLKTGQTVNLSGRVFTGRDRLHKFLSDGGKSPADLTNGALYHCGPVVIRKDGAWLVRAAGPTTSLRQERYMARVIEQHRVRVIIGKGGMGEATRRACARCGCVYLQAVGGAGVVLADTIKQVAGVHFLREFGEAEAMWELVIKGLKAVVAIDAHGRSLHKKVRISSRRALNRVLR